MKYCLVCGAPNADYLCDRVTWVGRVWHCGDGCYSEKTFHRCDARLCENCRIHDDTEGKDYCPDCVHYLVEQANTLTRIMEEKHVDTLIMCDTKENSKGNE